MKKRVLHALLGSAGLAVMLHSAPAAATDQCNFAVPRDVVIGLTRKDGEVRYDNEKSRSDLARMQKRSGQAGAFGDGWTPVGLTLTELRYTMKVKVEALKLRDGRYCARLTNVDAELGFDRMDVFVANRFRPGTCAYTSISNHEMTHVAVFRRALDSYYPRMHHRLERAARGIIAVQARNPQVAADYFQKQLRSSIDPLFNEMNRTMDRNNAMLDTPQRYRAEQMRCAEW